VQSQSETVPLNRLLDGRQIETNSCGFSGILLLKIQVKMKVKVKVKIKVKIKMKKNEPCVVSYEGAW
jgi:hypothetical protein